MLYRVYLSSANETLLVSAVKHSLSSVRLTFDHEDFEHKPSEYHVLDLTPEQVKKLDSAKKSGHEVILTLNKADIERNISVGGGIFDLVKGFAGPLIAKIGPVFMKALPALGLAAATGAISGAASAAANHGTNKALDPKEEGHGLHEDMDDIDSILKSHSKIKRQGKRSGYQAYSVDLTTDQTHKIARAFKEGSECSIKLAADQLTGGHHIYLTDTQLNKIKKCKAENKGLTLTMSKTQVKAQAVQGGWIESLLASLAGSLLPMLFGSNNSTAGSGLMSEPMPVVQHGPVVVQQRRERVATDPMVFQKKTAGA